MKKLPSSKAPSCAVDKYIGTDFDHVVTVSKEMESVKEVAEVTEHIVVTGSNIEAIKTVATNIGDVNNVSDNMEYVKDVAAGIEGLPVVSYIGSEPPAQPVEGATWYCTTDGRTYVWYKDIDSYQWVESSPQSIAKEDVRTPIVARAALERALLLDGYTLVTGSFELGAMLTKATDVILQEVTGKVYSWGGSFPATVPTGSTPDSTGGIGSNTWALRSVPEVLKRIEAEEADTQDWKGFTEELLAQAGTTDNGQPDELGNSQRVDAISRICGRQFANVDEMLAYYKLEVGTRYSTGGTVWEYNGFTDGTLLDFSPIGCINVKDFGAKGDGEADDTLALDAANAYAITARRNMLIPKGNFIYNGNGLKTNNFVNIVGEGANSRINCSNNNNTGYVITMRGFRTNVMNLLLSGNPLNAGLRAISCYYNTETSSVRNMVIEDFCHGVDIDKMWYFSISDVRFRTTSPTVALLDGAHITIGGIEPAEEVNNIVFSNIWMGGSQKNSVLIKGGTQNLRFEGCAFETKDTRILFDTTLPNNTTVLDSCYIEGSSKSSAQIARSIVGRKRLRIQNSLIRMAGTGNLVENILCDYEACYGNNPTSTLGDASSKATYVGDANSLNPADLFYSGVGGLYDSATNTTNNSRLNTEARPMAAKDYNSIIPKIVHQKLITGVTPTAAFSVYLPAGTDVRRIRLTVDVSVQCTVAGQWHRTGLEQWSLHVWKGRGTGDAASNGVRSSKVMQDSGGATLLSATAFTITQDGYHAPTDSTKYTIYYNLASDTYPGDVTFELSGMFMANAPEDRSRPWRLEKL